MTTAVAFFMSLAVLAGALAPAANAQTAPPPQVYLLTDSVVLHAATRLGEVVAPTELTTVGFPGYNLAAGPEGLQDVGQYDVVIIALGNNDPHERATQPERIDAILQAVRDVPRVIWVRPRNWSSRMRHINRNLDHAVLRWANLELADWNGLATGADLQGDRIHLSIRGINTMAQLLARHVRGEVAQDRPVFGRLDVVSSTPTAIRVGGWALDADTNEPIQVRIELDGRPTKEIAATTSRTDVDAIWNHGPNHGFVTNLRRVRDGEHTVCANAVDTAGIETALGCEVVTVANSPIGELERIRVVRGRIQVKGWAYDPNTAGNYVWIRVQGNKRRFVNNLATKPRPDIEALTQLTGNDHGFKFTIPIPDHIALDAQFCVFAIDSHKNRNTTLGCLM